MPIKVTFDNREFNKALQAYLDIRKNVNPKEEIKRRAKNIGMKLIKTYKEKGTDLAEITAKVKSLGFRVKIRDKIKNKIGKNGRKLTIQQQIAAETRARRSAKGFTATGWFPAVTKLGGNPKDKKRTGPQRGTLVEKLWGFNISETLVNDQPGAGYTFDKLKSPIQEAIDKETADMVIYILRKQDEAARKNGMK